MAKKQFIRHLEFYGFPDQNGYSSEINGVDLSDIREKNKEQDKEIQELEGEKAEKKDLLELSGTVENFIERQSEINQGFAGAISGMSADIDELKKVDDEFAEQLSAITDGVDDAMESIEILGERVDDLEDGLSALTETLENDYARKDEIVTQEWIEEQGYLTVESGDSRYTKIEDFEALSGAVESASTGIENIEEEIDTIIDTIETLSAETEEKIDEINDKIDSFSGEVESALTEINDEIDKIEEQVSGNTEDIDELQEEVSVNTEDIADLQEKVSVNTEDIADLQEKVADNTEDIADLQEKVSANTDDISNIYGILDTKANVSDLEALHNEMICKVEELDEKKADKTDLNAVSGAVDDLGEKLDREIERSTYIDERLTIKVNDLEEDVQEAVETVEAFNGRVSDLESGLAQEILDRQQGDLNLIGTEEDSRDADTIWGAKNFAKEMKRQAVSEAEVYTDEAVAGFSTELAEFRSEVEQELSTYATTGYVEQRLSETETEIENDYNSKIESESERAIERENQIVSEVDEIRIDVITAKEDIAHNSTIIHAITEWDGSDPDEYVDTGNGILDVLHREFHEYVRDHVNGDIKSITYEDGKLIIVYESKDGERVVEIPIGDIFDLSDYYKKEEVDDLLDEKADVTAITNIESSLLERINQLNQFLNNEVQRATSAETDLQTEITNIESTFEDRINQLTQFLNEERERAERVEEQLQGADITSGALSSELVVTVTQNNGNVITFSSPDRFELHAGEF